MTVRAGSCSVIIPAYNAAAFVGATVESVLAQTCAPAKVVVVDDGSHDDTVAVVAAYEPAVTLVSRTNGGPGAARNTGVAATESEYVAFLDSDDLWAPTRLEACLELLERDPAVQIATANSYLMYGDEPSEKVMYGDRYPYAFPAAEDQLATVARDNFLPSSIVLRRALFDQVGGYDEDRALISSEDYEICLRLMLAGARAGLIREPLGWYRLRDDALSANVSGQWAAHLLAIERNLPALRKLGVPIPGSTSFELARRAAERGALGKNVDLALLGLRSNDLPAARRVRAFASSLVKSIPVALRARAAS
jgi:glycosyltransferase involved in cell wall biosynthesis